MYGKIGFSMYTFNVEKQKEIVNNRISCLRTSCKDSMCNNINIEELKSDLNLPDCSTFFLYKKLGISVINIFTLI